MYTKKQEREAALERCREWFANGSTVLTILRHCSRSGMSRSIAVMAHEPGGTPWDVSMTVSTALGMNFDNRHGGIKISGCGMDMGYAIVYALGAALYPNGHPCQGVSCSSNDHSNGDRDYTAGKLHRDGGYAFRHRWL